MVKAIELRPDEPFLYNFYGRYIYEVCSTQQNLYKKKKNKIKCLLL